MRAFGLPCRRDAGAPGRTEPFHTGMIFSDKKAHFSRQHPGGICRRLRRRRYDKRTLGYEGTLVRKV